ncbi:MAG: hypothetical protein KC431_02815, partial [Myxococcales bacterium]|nr:hypothetical protein [Myxococcales bacterium]
TVGLQGEWGSGKTSLMNSAFYNGGDSSRDEKHACN